MTKKLEPLGRSLATVEQNLMDAIREKTPQNLIKKRKGRGGLTFQYVAGSDYIRKLNEVFGHKWSFVVKDVTQFPTGGEATHLAVHGQLTVLFPDGTQVTKEQFGSSAIKYQKKGTSDDWGLEIIDIGDDLKAAATDSLKKCASLLGIFLDIYGDPEPVESDRLPTAEEFAAFQALGHELYGEEWDTKRHELTKAVSKGAVASSKELLVSEINVLMGGLKEKLKAIKTNGG